MKKTFLRAALCLSLAASITSVVVSCSSNTVDEIIDGINGQTVDPNNFKGEIKSGNVVTLDATKTYKLTGKLLVEDGATLIIPAGTKIVADEGATYLIVDRGGKIFINGTAAAPVTFEGAANRPGTWGGLVILGKAPSNRSAAGTSTSELGDLTYGGTTKDDNSGVIQYVKIKNSGFKYNPSKEFNGLSLFGVGSGTKVSYVYIYDGADDGVEFFGGNVNADHIVVLGVGDDSVDWTEGWQGTAEYIYAARKKEYVNDAEPGNRGVEADTQDTDPNTTFGNGASNPTIKNATFLGNVKGSESQAMKIRAGSQGKFENIVLSNYATGVDFETDRTLAWFQGAAQGTSYLKDIRFEAIGTNVKAKNTAGTAVDLTAAVAVSTTATGAGSVSSLPSWAQGWTGVTSFTAADAGN